ncbi:MAG: Hsp20/alpha crystallin family protein, partial [Candidatus Micrarchaeota archaeon]|nr:Hsp20/alpha crystallin family protein [Candidatus Micrarchaeota archaeon]
GELQWRKICLKADSPLLKKPESLGSTVRLMAGLQFPDILIEKSSPAENLVHVANKPAVAAIPDKLRKDMGMVSVYLVSNDKAAKIASDIANSNVEKYKKLGKEAMDLFMKMTPEEREQAMASGIEQMQQYDPKFLAEMSTSVLKNPDLMQRMMQGMPRDEVRRLSERRGPQVYGFSVRVGPDGKPVVTEFGDIQRKQTQDVRALEGGNAQENGEGGERETGNGKREAEEREPLVDVFKDRKGVNVIAEMPGVSEKEVQLSVNGKEVEIRAEGARKYYRKVELPEDVGKKRMEKKYRNGVLELVFS